MIGDDDGYGKASKQEWLLWVHFFLHKYNTNNYLTSESFCDKFIYLLYITTKTFYGKVIFLYLQKVTLFFNNNNQIKITY